MNNPTNELQDLKLALAQLEQRCATNFGKVEAMARDLMHDKTRSLVRRATWLPAAELVAEGLVLALACSGLSRAGGWVYLGSVLAVIAVTLALMVSAIVQIVCLLRLDPAAPVLVAQRQLARVGAFRVQEWRWVLLLSPLLWTPFCVVAVEVPLRLLAGAALAQPIFTANYVLVSLAIGAVVALVLHQTSGWLARRWQGSSFVRGLTLDLAGRRLVAARAFLARIDDFERR